ncbi:hypothetical protein RQP46_010323 [Phenoliferia psychrophenolica]
MLQPATRSLHFIPEIISLIVAELAATFGGAISRNAAILRVALVDKRWSTAALPLLYSDLHLEWRLSYVERFLAAIELEPLLLLRVTRLVATRTTLSGLTAEAQDQDGLVTDEDIEERYYSAWKTLVDEEDPIFGIPERNFEDWVTDERWEDARRDIISHPDRPWADEEYKEVSEGEVAFWAFIPRLARLKHLCLKDFSGAAEHVKLTEEAEPILAQLESLEVREGSDGATLSAALMRAATGLRHLTIEAYSLRKTPLIPALHLPQLRHITVIDWSALDDKRSQEGSSYTVLDLALACRNTLETLEVLFRQERQHRRSDHSGADLVALASALPHLKVLRNLQLSPRSRWRPRCLKHHDDITYPSPFLDALSHTTLHSFAINEPPTTALLDALPPTVQLLTFNLETPTYPLTLKRADLLNRAVTLLIAAKDDLRLPLLRHATLKRPRIGSGELAYKDATEAILVQKRVREEEEEHLGWEQRAAAAGFRLKVRPSTHH